MTLVIKKRAEGWLIYKVRKSGRTLPVPERLRPARGLWRKEMKTERQTGYGNPFWPDFIKIGSTVPSPTILKNTLLTAAFALIMSALSAQSANIPILALPFKITAPGTYVLTRNLIYSLAANVAPGSPGSPPPAITISSTTPGQIVLDLKGFSITGTVCLRIDTDS